MTITASTAEWARLEQLTDALPATPAFDATVTSLMPPAARRYLDAAIAPGTPLAPGARLTMRGSIKLGRWLPFRARQLLVPSLGTVWVARVGGVIFGSDRYVAGVGGMEWKLLRLFRVMRAEGADVTRSAAERAAGESIWVPTAVAVAGELRDDGIDRVRVDLTVDGHPVTVHHELAPDGRLGASWFQRWGDPDRSGTWALHPFGVEALESRTFDGVTFPARGQAGWHYGTERWGDGVFFRYEITDYELVAAGRR